MRRKSMSLTRWIRVSLSLLAVTAFAFTTSPRGATSPPADGEGPPLRAEIPSGHVHGSGLHKILVPSDDRAGLDRLAALGVVDRQLDYGSFKLVVAKDGAIPALGESALARA